MSKRISSVTFFSKSTDYIDFWNSIGLEGQKKLEDIIKNKTQFEREFKRKFLMRYIHERDYHTLINMNFLFGNYNVFSRVFYLMFQAVKKEGKIINEYIDYILDKRDQEFLSTILNNENTQNFQVSLDPYKIEIQNITDSENFDFITKYIPNEIAEPFLKKRFKTETVSFVGNDSKKQILIKYNLYDFNLKYNFITVYSELENTAFIYLSPTITIRDFNFVGLTRYLLWKNIGIKKVKFFNLPTYEEFDNFRAYISVFQVIQFKIMHSIQTNVFKRWILSSLTNTNIGDFSTYIFKRGLTGFSRVETEYNNNGYRTIKNEGIIFEKFKRDLQALGVKLEGLSTLAAFDVGKVSYRISIINNDSTFQCSIRRTNNDFYSKEDIISNGFELDLLLKEDDFSAEDYRASHYEKLESFGEGGKYRAFTLADFLNAKDINELYELMYETTGFSYLIGETGSGKTTLLKVYFSEFIRMFLKKGIVKKVISLEAPLEEIDYNFYQIGYDLNNFSDVEEIVKATKTSKPDVVLLSETKDPQTMKMIYEEAQLHHSVSTIHKADILGFVSSLIGYSIDLNLAGTDMISKINFAIALNKMKIVDYESLEKKKGKLEYKPERENEKMLYYIFGNELSEDINSILEKKEIKILNNQSKSEFVQKVNNDQFQKTYILYERLFKKEAREFLKKEFEEGTYISNDIILNKAKYIYKYIGSKNRMIYKLILLLLSGYVLEKDEGKVQIAISEINGLTVDEKKDFIRCLMEDLNDKSIKTKEEI